MTTIPQRQPEESVNPKAAVLVAAAALAAIAAVVYLDGLEGPAARCEDAGGHYLVGPGGETACVDRRTFLPMTEYGRR